MGQDLASLQRWGRVGFQEQGVCRTGSPATNPPNPPRKQQQEWVLEGSSPCKSQSRDWERSSKRPGEVAGAAWNSGKGLGQRSPSRGRLDAAQNEGKQGEVQSFFAASRLPAPASEFPASPQPHLAPPLGVLRACRLGIPQGPGSPELALHSPVPWPHPALELPHRGYLRGGRSLSPEPHGKAGTDTRPKKKPLGCGNRALVTAFNLQPDRFLFKIYCNGVRAKGGGEGWGTCRGHRNTMTWPGPRLLSWGRGMKRKGQGWSWGGRGKGGDTAAAFPPLPGSTSIPGSPPIYPGPVRFHLLSCLWP
ncbi:uncharacterized protein LOC119241749 [Talpa occidentalis]|uniref:uncharacterized protein LOC119241749 n=1 Tax=Talpa occidentalis TaxID=50954 RepID=UPI00189035BF|nr:uncharacterized protein LOC119241749 [Talpa occidentalis]